MKASATFSASLDDDSVWSDKGDIMIPGGRLLSSILYKRLCDNFYIVRGPTQHSFYAWLIEVKIGRISAKCYIQDLQPWSLIVETKRSFLAKKHDLLIVHHKIVDVLKAALNADARISNVKWDS